MLRKLLYFRKRERLGIIILSLLILISLIFRFITRDTALPQEVSPTEASNFDKALKEYKELTAVKQIQVDKTKPLQSFNPNRDDVNQLTAAGLPINVARNIINYRNKGGKFYQKSDVKKLYAVSDSLYNAMATYIVIDITKNRDIKPPFQKTEKEIAKPNYVATKATKYEVGTIINLNQADTTELKKIPGIGSYTAAKIVRYKERLGGFYSAQQLTEIDSTYHKFVVWFATTNPSIRKKNINKLTFKELLKHPYMNFEKVKAVFNLKREKGDVKSLEELSFLPDFTEEEIEKLKFYFVTQDSIN